MIKYISDSVEWFDKTNGNPYSATRIISTETGEVIKVFPFGYGHGHNNAMIFKKAEGLHYCNVYETSQPGTRKQAEAWGKL